MAEKGETKILAIITICIMLISINFLSTNINADIAPEPTYSGGILTKERYNSYLKNVNVSLKIYEEEAVGVGIFIIQNPSNNTENMTLYFDPGTRAINSLIKVNEIEVDTNKTFIKDYYNHVSRDVPTFYVEIEKNSSIIIKINWKMEIKRNWRRTNVPFMFFTDYETWSARYLIIGTKSWNRNIESVKIIFDIRTDGLKNSAVRKMNETGYSDIQPNKTSKNEMGFNVHEFVFNNFSYPELTLYIINTKSKRNYIPTIVIWGTLLIILILVIIKRLKKKANIKLKK